MQPIPEDQKQAILSKLKENIAAEFSSLGASARMIADFAALSDRDLLFFIECIDESEYSLHEWAEALVKFYAWEDAESRVLTPLHKIEYLSCCVQGATGTGKLVSLADLWMEYLTTYGVE